VATCNLVTNRNLADLSNTDHNLLVHAWVEFITLVAIQDVQANDGSRLSVRHAQGSVTDITSLLTKDCAEKGFHAGKIAAAFAEHRHVQDVMVFLLGHGVSIGFVARIVKRYGKDAIKIVQRTQKINIDWNAIPLNDAKTFGLLSKAQSIGIFQLESSGMRDILKKLKPDKFEDLIAILALYRPGPIGSGMVDEFIKRKHGLIPILYDHPLLEPILKDTYGIIVFQEQIMKIVNVLAGFSLGKADSLRRAISKKKEDVMQEVRADFTEGCVKKKVDAKIAEKIFNLIVHFAGYGFNKSHSAAYAVISFRTAYLKANFPVEFMTALLSSEKDNTDKVVLYIDEAKRMGETMCGVFYRTFGMDVRIVRIFNTYGPRMDLDDGRIIPSFLRSVLEGEPLTVFGDGSQTRSYCYVDDLVRGIVSYATAQGLAGETMNLGNPEEFTVLSTAHTVRNLFPKQNLSIVHKPLPLDDPTRRRPDISKAMAKLQWQPHTALKEGLLKTFAWAQTTRDT
jgi:hypothetical protein